MMTNNKTEQFIKNIPKTDLHVHLDGSLRISTLIELAKKEKVNLPSYEETGLKETVFKDKYENLAEYLKGFALTCAVLRNPENIERVAYELAQDNIAENVRYLEVRFAPQLLLNQELQNISQIVEAVYKGLEKAKSEYESTNEFQYYQQLPFHYGIIVGAMRRFNEKFSPYYANLLKDLPHTTAKEMYSLASLELARSAVQINMQKGLPIVGFDLCGEEAGYPATIHSSAFNYVHKNFLGKTLHAGEAYGPESIFKAITDCHANRLGHGTLLYEHETVKDPDIECPESFSNSLAEYIAKRRITIESCPTSNLQTLSWIKDIKNHPIRKMIANRLSVTICTDNRLISNTNVTKELNLVTQNIPLSKKELKDLVIAGFKGCFFPGTYRDHRGFVRKVIDRYTELEEKYLSDLELNDKV